MASDTGARVLGRMLGWLAFGLAYVLAVVAIVGQL